MLGAEEGLPQLQHDPGAAELGERVRGRARRDDRAVGQHVARAVVIRDDDLEAERSRLRDLRDRGDPAVDRHEEAHALVDQPGERVAGHAVALLEPARQMPHDVGIELAEDQDRECGRADPVDVVVAVHADAPAVLDRRPDPLHGGGHVAEEPGIVARQRRVEKATRVVGIAVPAADEDRGGHVADAELTRERRDAVGLEGGDRPCTRHPKDGTDGLGRRFLRRCRPTTRGACGRSRGRS